MNLVLIICHSDKKAIVEPCQREVIYKETKDSIEIFDKGVPANVIFSGKIQQVFPEKNNYDLLAEDNVPYKLFKSESSIKLIRMDNSYDGKPYVWIFDK